MQTIKTSIYLFAFLTISLFQPSCKKYLDAKSDGSLSTPSTLKDLQAMVDNYDLMNTAPDLINTFSDEYYVNEADWIPLDESNKRGYVWDAELNNEADWGKLYSAVFYANTILDQLEKISPSTNPQKWNELKGAALFFRAFHFFNLVQLFARQYDPQTASSDLGIPLRVSSDFNEVSVRATIQQTYERIIQDLENAAELLSKDGGYKTRPNQAAAFGLLARVYLQMSDYGNALGNANKCLTLYDTLMDYNDKDPTVMNPFPKFNPETIYYAFTTGCLNIYDWIAKADTTLYKSYSPDDLRKILFFKDIGTGGVAFEGHYTENSYELFAGIATDEIYLIKAECHARLGQTESSMETLNKLLITRWKEGAFIPVIAGTSDEALGKVLNERRKQLVNRGVRWGDLRRLNKETRFATTLQRNFGNGNSPKLPPDDKRYVSLIPRSVILRSGIPQNER